MQTKVMIALFGLFAEVERDLISERTKEGLAAARAKGRLLGRPKGSLGTSKLDGKEEEIRMLLEKEVSKASIAKIVGVSSTNLHHFIRTRKLDPKAPEAKYGAAVLRAYFRSNLGGTPGRGNSVRCLDISPPQPSAHLGGATVRASAHVAQAVPAQEMNCESPWGKPVSK